jgi:hypothetical protein
MRRCFPEASKGGKAFARVLSAVAAIDEHAKNHVLGRAEARRIKEATRESVFEYLKTIAAAARRVTRVAPSVNPFVLPTRRSLAAELATARAFMEAAATRPEFATRVRLLERRLRSWASAIAFTTQEEDWQQLKSTRQRSCCSGCH